MLCWLRSRSPVSAGWRWRWWPRPSTASGVGHLRHRAGLKAGTALALAPRRRIRSCHLHRPPDAGLLPRPRRARGGCGRDPVSRPPPRDARPARRGSEIGGSDGAGLPDVHAVAPELRRACRTVPHIPALLRQTASSSATHRRPGAGERAWTCARQRVLRPLHPGFPRHAPGVPMAERVLLDRSSSRSARSEEDTASRDAAR